MKELIFRQRRLNTGVALIRLAGLTPQRKAQIVGTAIAEHGHELKGNFGVITAGTVRIRRTIE